MPKMVDHAERREQLTEAAAGVIAGRGLDATGLREVARASALTTGAVTHYFSSKAALIDAAYVSVMERLFERQADGLAAESPTAVAARLAEFLPGDTAGLRDWRVWLAFSARALVDPGLAARHRHYYARITAAVAAELGSFGAGAGAGYSEALTAADALVAVVDGLGVRMLLEPGAWPAERVMATLARVTPLFFAGEGDAG